MDENMADKKNIMIIGLEPTLIDFSDPFLANSPGLNATKILDGLNAAAEKLRREGYNAQICLTDSGETNFLHIFAPQNTGSSLFNFQKKRSQKALARTAISRLSSAA
jgi:hypothetical protein